MNTQPPPHFSVIKKFQKYFAALRVNAINSRTFALNLFARSLAVLFRIWIFTQIYQATYATTGQTTIGDFSLPMVIWSLMLTQSFETASRPAVSKAISTEVQDGSLAYSVSKPYSYILFHFWSTIGRTLPLLLNNIIIGGICAYFLVGFTSFSIAGIVLGLLNLFLGFWLDFSICLTIGLSALWLEDTDSLTAIYHKLRLVFGGLILPIALFPPALRTIAEFLPFSQLYYAAARQAVAFNWTTFINSITIQISWIVIFSLIAMHVMRRGMKQISVNGG